jgi:phenylacetate-CoA ligase
MLEPESGGTAMSSATVHERITEAVRYCYQGSAFYRDKLKALGVRPEDVRSLDDLAALPVLLDKEAERNSMLSSLKRDGHPYGEYLCAPLEEVVGVGSTSGTTGDPTFYPFTKKDIAVQDDLWARGFAFAGLKSGETVMHAFGLSMFLAGYPVVRALERMGARPIPVGAEAGSEKLGKYVRLTRPTAICLTPSYAEYLMEKYAVESWGIKRVFCAGEPGAGLPEFRARIANAFGGAQVTDMMGGGKGIMSVSCAANAGMHALGQEHWVQQLIDPDTRAPLEWTGGNIGMRVVTTLSWQAAPWLRAGPGDICEAFDDECECGLTTQRYRVVGRADDMLIVKGVKIYPAAIRNLLNEYVPRLTGHFRIQLDEPGPKVKPPLKMRVEVAEQGGSREPEGADVLAEIIRVMHGRFGITPVIEAIPAGSLPREAHKEKLIEIRSSGATI